MKIYSWNMLFRNQELDRAFDFIEETEFDIFCLQEVPEGFLRRLQKLPYFIAYRIDVERIVDDDVHPHYVVILSKHPIAAQGEIPLPDYQELLPLRSRAFIRLMKPFGFAKIRNRGAIYADIRVPSIPRTVRVFNLHLILARPEWRLKEFETAMAERDPSRPTIVCGDFNTIESAHISGLNWILGGRAHEAFLYTRERTQLEERFVAHELQNVLRDNVTHPLSRSQLDHILVSHSFSIQEASVVPDRIGSDHHPIRAEVA